MSAMPIIEVEFSEQEMARLQEEYRKESLAILESNPDIESVSFSKWLGERLRQSSPEGQTDLQPVRAFDAIEKLVFALQRHQYALVDYGKRSSPGDKSFKELAHAIANDVSLPAQYEKRIGDLLAHFARNAKELVDAANIGVTPRTRDALLEAHRMLVVRTEKALASLGNDRAIGRVEGGAAILVAIDVMDRAAAKQKTDEFKIQVRSGARSTWSDKLFGSTGNEN
jgi:hypothetical protein